MANNGIYRTNEWYRIDDHLPHDEAATGRVIFSIPPGSEEWFRPTARNPKPVRASLYENNPDPWTDMVLGITEFLSSVVLVVEGIVGLMLLD